MAVHFGVAVVDGPHARFEEVRHALWLPRKPDAMYNVGDVASSVRGEDHLGILDDPDRVRVYGHRVLEYASSWAALSADGGRVFVLHYDADVLSELWAIYEDGVCRRAVNAVEDEGGGVISDEVGERHPLEPPSSTDIDRLAALHLAIVGSEIEDQDLERTVAAWRIAESDPEEAGA